MEEQDPVEAQGSPTKDSFGSMVVRTVLVVLVVGLGVDACSGFGLARTSRSGVSWLLGTLAFGALYWFGEDFMGKLAAVDETTDPLGVRIGHAAGLVVFWALVMLAFHVILRWAT